MAKKTPKTKVCTKCGKRKKMDMFGKNSKRKDGKMSSCKECANEQCRLYRIANPEKRKKTTAKYRATHQEDIQQYNFVHRAHKADYDKKYYPANKDKKSEQARVYRTTHQEQIREQKKEYRVVNRERLAEEGRKHYAANREKIRGQQKAWRDANPERARAYARQWRVDHPDECRNSERKSGKKWRDANPEKESAKNRRRRERAKGLDGNWSAQMERFVREFWSACAICGKTHKEEGRQLAIDHWLPLVKGHALSMTNSVLLCKSCNSRKQAQLPGGVYDTKTINRIEKKIKQQAKQWEAQAA